MRPRISILNLLLLTTIVALVVVVARLSRQLADEKTRRLALLQKGGILQVADPNVVHVVQVSAPGELNTLRWRVHVPAGRTVALNATLEPVPRDDPPAPRLPPNAIVVPVRAAPKPIKLGPGEHVVSFTCDQTSPEFALDPESYTFRLDVVGAGGRNRKVLHSRDNELRWYYNGYRSNITHVEHTARTAREFQDGRTLPLANGKTFVLCRFREQFSTWSPGGQPGKSATSTAVEKVAEVLVWLHPDDL
jgi:hypothetical protein